MAYTTRWRIYTENPETGNTINVYIMERDYSGSSTVLDPGGELVTIRYTPIGMFSGTPHWTMAASEATIEFVDDGTGQLIDVLSGDDEQFQVRIAEENSDEWYGFVVPDSYGFTPYQRGIATITASDRLGTLNSAAYLQSTGYVYSGRASIIEVIANCLSPIASGLYFSTYMNWYPYIGTNDLDSTDNPLANLYVDQEIFYDDDGNPFSCGYILEQVCGRFLLQLFQANGIWMFVQRRRSTTSDQFTVFNYLNTGAEAGTATTALDAFMEIDGTTNNLVGPYATGTVPYGSVSTTYFHGNTFADQFENLSFEDVLYGTIQGTPLVDTGSQTGSTLQIDGITSTGFLPAGMQFTVAGLSNTYELATSAEIVSGSAVMTLTAALESSPADNAAVTFYNNVGNWEYDNTSGFPANSPNASDGGISLSLSVDFETSPFSYESDQYVTQRSREQVAGGSGYRIRGGWDVNVPSLDDVTTELYMAFRMYIDVGGTPYYYKWSDSTWTTTATINEVPLASFNLGNNRWDTFTFVTGELDDTGTPLTGYLYFTFLEGHEFDGGGSATTGLVILVDNFQQPVLIDANFLPAGDATQTTITYDTNVNRSKPEPTQFIFGDGPTTAHVKRLTVTDSTGAAVDDITGDWNFGPAVSGSGNTLDQFWANVLLKQYRRSARVLTTGVHSVEATTPYKPYMMLRIANTNNTTEPDYWWQTMEYRPASPWYVTSGTWTEFVAGAGGNLLCEYSVQGSSVAALSLTLEQGIPCATGGTAIAPSVPAGTLFVSTYDSSNTLMPEYSMMRVDPDGSTTVLKSYVAATTPQLTFANDPVRRWLLVVDGLNIRRMRYDGSEDSLIFTLSGYTRIGDIDYIPSGTYAGEFVFFADGSGGPGGVDDDIYRIDIDGNETKISTNKFAGNLGVAVRSSTEVICNAAYTNAGIVSYGLAGTVYAVENSVQIFNSGNGITYDPDNDQAYLEKGIATSSLSRTPSGLSGAYTDFNGFSTLSRLTPMWFDRTQQRIWYGGSGINYRAVGALGTAVQVAPLTGGSGTTGSYGTTKIIAVQ